MDQTTKGSLDDESGDGHREMRDATTASIAATLIEHSKMLQAILRLMTEVASKDDDELGMLLQAIIARLGEQTAALAEVSAGLAKLGRDLPLDLVAAIDDQFGPQRRTNGRGDQAASS